jgi:hypothetical protein
MTISVSGFAMQFAGDSVMQRHRAFQEWLYGVRIKGSPSQARDRRYLNIIRALPTRRETQFSWSSLR